MKEVYEETGHRGRAGVAHRGARRSAARLLVHAALLAGLPLPDDRRRARGPPARDPPGRVLPARRAAAAARRPAPLGRPRVPGHRRRGLPRRTSTRPAPRPGASSPPVARRSAELARGQVWSWSPRRRTIDTAPFVASHASATLSWSTSPHSPGAMPSSVGGAPRQRRGLEVVAVRGEALEPVPERGERPGLAAELDRVRRSRPARARRRRAPRGRSATARSGSVNAPTGWSRHSRVCSSPVNQVWEPFT